MPKILVVEEGVAARDSLAAVFTAAGLEPVHAGSSREALQRYEDEPIDLVLTEVRLAEMDGILLARKLRQLDPDAIVLCMTALERKNDLRRAIREGVFDFFVKPFGAHELTESLRRALVERERRRARASVPVPPAREEVVATVDPARLAALEEREAAVAEREATLERAVDEFEASGMGMMGGGGIDPEELAEREAALLAGEQALAQREELLTEREEFLEQSENALFERGQRLQELETELEHRAEGLGPAPAPALPAPAAIPAEVASQRAELEARASALDVRERELETRFGALLEREKRLKKNEALVRAREQYLRQSENILFETED
jgi:CheY-like chemotaxis protein